MYPYIIVYMYSPIMENQIEKKMEHQMETGILKGYHFQPSYMRVVVKIMVPFWIPIIIRHLIFRVPKKGP